MKELIWLGDTLKILKEFSSEAKQKIGHDLNKLQIGLMPSDWKVMRGLGLGVKELRIHAEKEYRVIYMDKFFEATYVLHVFIKKEQKTSRRDIAMAKSRYELMLKMRKLL